MPRKRDALFGVWTPPGCHSEQRPRTQASGPGSLRGSAVAVEEVRRDALLASEDLEILPDSQIARGSSNGDLVASGICSPLTCPRVKIRKGPAVEQKGCLL